MYTDTSETTPHPASNTSHQGKVIGNDTILTYHLHTALHPLNQCTWFTLDRFSEYEESMV